jgi:hypothetical protein
MLDANDSGVPQLTTADAAPIACNPLLSTQ